MRQTIESGFFNAYYDGTTGTYDREYSSAQFRELFSLFFTNGVFVNYGEEFVVSANSSMEVTVGSGFGFINGAWLKNPSDFSITITSNNTLTTRIDGIFLQMSTLNRDCAIVYREADVEPMRGESTYELLLATVSVASSASVLTQANVTDMRATDLCGFVGGAVQQMSVSGLYAQFTEQFTQWMTAEQLAFDAWFENIKEQLSADAAGNLQLQVNDLNTDLKSLSSETTSKFDQLFSYDESTGELVIKI